MATILNFVMKTPDRRRRAPAGTTAAIVFFPGVRYERNVQTERPKPASGAAGSKAGKALPAPL